MGRAHAQALKGLDVELAVCDLREEAQQSLGREFGISPERCFANSDELLAETRPDLVIIATTADTHAALTFAAAEAGAGAILCEKPMAVSVAECDAMLDACAACGTRLAINHQMRFMDQYRLVKTVLDRGRLGRLASMNVVGGCFGLAMNGSHYVEAFHYLTGDWPVIAAARFTGGPVPNPRGPAFFDQAGDVLFVAAGGQRLSLSIGHDQGHGMTVTYAAATGHIFVDELEGEAIVTARRPEHQEQPSTRYGMLWDRKTLRFRQADNVGPTRATLDALLAGADYPDGECGRQVVAAIAACYSSAERGGAPVAVAELPRDRCFPWA
jgi:predicted dehydrogenase